MLVYWAGPFRRKIHRAYSSSGEYDASTAANMRQFGAVMAWVGALILSGLAILFFSGGFIAVGLLLAVPAFMLGIGGWISYRNSKRVDEIK